MDVIVCGYKLGLVTPPAEKGKERVPPESPWLPADSGSMR